MFTKKKIDLKNSSIQRLFFYYFLPALFAMMATSTYSTVDGIFVGQKLGSEALAAIGIVWPLFTALFGYELLFGAGSATLISYFLSKSDFKKVRLIFSSVFYFASITSFLISILGYVYADEIAYFLGARGGSLHLMVRHYIEIIFLGAFFMVVHPLLDILIVNDGRPKLAMIAMMCGAGLNVIFNYIFLFVFEFDIRGAAVATILAHIIGFMVLLTYFFSPSRNLRFVKRFSINAVLVSMKTGLPSSISELSAGVMILYINSTIIHIAGSRGVSLYSIVVYIGYIFFTISLSIAQGVQPIASYIYGLNDYKRLKSILIFGNVFALCVGLILYFVTYFIDSSLILLFIKAKDVDAQFIKDAQLALSLCLINYCILGVNICNAVFLQSIQRTASSLILTISQTLLFLVPLLYFFTNVYGLMGVWITLPVAQSCAFVVGVFILFYEFKFGEMSKIKKGVKIDG